MRKLLATSVLALVFAAGSAGCGKKVSISDLKKLKEEACACHDATCADAITKKLEDTLGNASEDDVGKEGMSISMDIAVCLGKAKAGL